MNESEKHTLTHVWCTQRANTKLCSHLEAILLLRGVSALGFNRKTGVQKFNEENLGGDDTPTSPVAS